MDSVSGPSSISKNRSRTEIISTIITLAQNGASQAKIREKAHLNSKQIKRYLDELTRLGLVKVNDVDGRKTYITSRIGNEYLEQHNSLRKLLT